MKEKPFCHTKAAIGVVTTEIRFSVQGPAVGSAGIIVLPLEEQ